MSISKNQLKTITSLSQKKYRQKHQLFIAEGVKVVNELLNSSFKVDTLFALDTFETNIREIERSSLMQQNNIKAYKG